MATDSLHIFDLPSEIYLQVFDCLDYKDIVNCSKTCRLLNEVCEDDRYWRNLYKFHWDESSKPDCKTWKECFIEQYKDKRKYMNVYKKVKRAWDVIRSKTGCLDPSTVTSLKYGMTEEELNGLEMEFGVNIPVDVRCIYRFHSGQKLEERANGIFGTVQNYDYFKKEMLLPLTITTIKTGISVAVVVGDENAVLMVVLKDKGELKTGNLITKAPPTGGSYLILANSFLEYFLDYAKKLEEDYFPVVDGMLYRFYRNPSSVALSHDVNIQVSTAFLPELVSDSYVFAYLVQFSMDKNVSKEMSCQLESRHWEIVEGDLVRVVDGPGVIGLTPTFQPGSKFSYISCNKSQLARSSMKGFYTVRNLASGERYNLTIPEFDMFAGTIITLPAYC